MIKDKDFKLLKHESSGYDVFLKGENAESGYRPDYVLKRDNKYIILESENKASRKTLIGGLLKAAHFLTGGKSGVLIYVITPKKDAKVPSIVGQIKPYFDYIREITNLQKVYIIKAEEYVIDGVAISIDSEKFKESSVCIE